MKSTCGLSQTQGIGVKSSFGLDSSSTPVSSFHLQPSRYGPLMIEPLSGFSGTPDVS